MNQKRNQTAYRMGQSSDLICHKRQIEKKFPSLCQNVVLYLVVCMCLLIQGCAGRKSDSGAQSVWSFQASRDGQTADEDRDLSEEASTSDGDAAAEYVQTSGDGSADDRAVGDGIAVGGGQTSEDGDGIAADAGQTLVSSASSGDSQSAGSSDASTDSQASNDNTAGDGMPSGMVNEDGQTAASDTDAKPAAAGYVYVCGAVEHPGVYEVYEGMRIFEAVALAGGMTEDADTVWINQAQQVADGQQIQIYTKEETAQMRSSGMTGGTADTGSGQAEQAANASDSDSMAAASGSADGKVNINTAGREELMTLPGIGEAKADAIIQYRQEHGSFSSIEDICLISGIKEAVFSNIRDRITV